MNKIIFLDIDGVLNVYPQGRDEFGAKFHTHFENNLKWIIDKTDAKIVISSTWKIDGLEVMQKMWKERNLPGEVIDITPNIIEHQLDDDGTFFIRGYEIQQWIHDNGVESYVILDDDIDILPSQRDNFVQTSENFSHPDCIDVGYGLTRQCAAQAIVILNRK